MKETKLKNLVKYGNNNTVSVNVRYGCTSCFNLPVKNDSTENVTFSISIEDEFNDSSNTSDKCQIVTNINE